MTGNNRVLETTPATTTTTTTTSKHNTFCRSIGVAGVWTFWKNMLIVDARVMHHQNVQLIFFSFSAALPPSTTPEVEIEPRKRSSSTNSCQCSLKSPGGKRTAKSNITCRIFYKRGMQSQFSHFCLDLRLSNQNGGNSGVRASNVNILRILDARHESTK